MSLFGFLTNIFYHENSTIGFNDFELAKLKLDLVSSICYLIALPLPEPVLSEGLRTLANLSRNKQIAKHMCSVGFGDGLVALLNHESSTAVYYSLGCLINISNERLFYDKQADIEYLSTLKKIHITTQEILKLSLQVFCNMLNFYKREKIDIKGSKSFVDMNEVLYQIKELSASSGDDQPANNEMRQIHSMIEYAERLIEDDKNELTSMKLNEILRS